MQPISVDMSKVTWKDGKLHIPVHGCEIKLEVIPTIRLAPELVEGEMFFYANIALGGTAISEGEGIVKTNEALSELLSKEPIMPTQWKYDDLTIGFVYSTPQDPNNHNWMIAPRIGTKIGEMLFAEETCDLECPMATISWHEGGNWHGRFCIVKKDVKELKKKNPRNLTIVGHKCGGYPEGDKEYPEFTKTISIRYNIHNDKWYLSFRDLDDVELKEIEIDGILSDIKMYGHIDKNHDKPKVTQFIKTEDIASLKIMSKMAIIYGK